jgi:hypothetical protein
MSRKSLRAALAALVLGWSTTLVFAQQLGTAEEARATGRHLARADNVA